MPRSMIDLRRFLLSIHPYDSLPDADLQRVLTQFTRQPMQKDQVIYPYGAPSEGLYVILEGEVEITTDSGETVSRLSSRNTFGERGLMRDGKTGTNARALSDGELLLLPADAF
ncbi:MAG: cyclic nucleotide-binding domain-containing protein, partial [Loktanella sp.]|nr:cyclic nucleotide-binding domain-containing protein [Loktanella sp.]